LLAAEHGTDIVETILRIQRKTNDDHLWSDVIVGNRLTARAEIGIATFQHVDAKIQWFILPTGHSNRVPKLHGNLQQKGAFGESVHEAKETILVNDHVT